MIRHVHLVLQLRTETSPCPAGTWEVLVEAPLMPHAEPEVGVYREESRRRGSTDQACLRRASGLVRGWGASNIDARGVVTKASTD